MRKDARLREYELIDLLKDEGWVFISYLLNRIVLFKDGKEVKLVAVRLSIKCKVTKEQRDVLQAFYAVGIKGYTWAQGSDIKELTHNGNYEEAENDEEKKLSALQSAISKDLIHLFATQWFDKYGIPMHIKYYYYKNMFNLLYTYGKEDIISGMKAYFGVVDRFVLNSQHSLGLFLSAVDKYIVISKKPKEGRGRTS